MSDESTPFPTPPTNVNNLARHLQRTVDDALDSKSKLKTNQQPVELATV